MQERAHIRTSHPQNLLNYTIYRRELGMNLPLREMDEDEEDGSPGFGSAKTEDIHATTREHRRYEERNNRAALLASEAECRRDTEVVVSTSVSSIT